MSDSHMARNDSDKVYIGPNGSYLSEISSDLTFYDPTLGAEKTLSELAASGLITDLDTAFDGGKVIDGATSSVNALQIGGANDKIKMWEEGDDDLRISTSGGNLSLDAAGNQINILSDTTKLGFGAGGVTDGYIYHDGTNLRLYSSAAGEHTLLSLTGSNLASPTVTGDMTISDGKIVQIDTDDEIALSITSSSTTNDALKVAASLTSSGAVIAAHATDATLAGGGFYFRAYGGASNLFTIGRYGATVIAGNAGGTDALTVTAGDLTLSSGDLAILIGTITVADTADSANKISRNNATGTNPVLEIEQTHATGGVGLLIDQNATGDVNALEITNAGTGYAVTTTGGAAGSEGYEMVFATGGTGNGLFLDGNTNTYVGADGTGMIHAHQSGTLAHANATCLFINFDGTYATNGVGGCLRIDDDGAADGTNFSAEIDSTNVGALKITDGKTYILDEVEVEIADTTNVDALTIDQNDSTNNKDALVITCAGTGKGIKVTTETATGTGSHFICAANQTTANMTVDGDTAGWLGADAVGMVHLTNDIAHAHANATMLLIDKSAAISEVNDARGSCLRIVENMNVSGSPPAYAAYISSTNNEALLIDSGELHVDEEIHVNRAGAGAGLGHIKIGGTADHAGAAGENVITIFDGAASPTGAVANGSSLYSAAGELTGIDSGGNATTLTPHTKDGFYVINSYSSVKDETLRVHLELLLTGIVNMFPELGKCIERIPGKAKDGPLQVMSPVL